MSDKPIPYIKSSDIMNSDILGYIYNDRYTNYYWSENFSPDFYMHLAQSGFISTAIKTEEMEILLPEMQKSYAVLHFRDLHISKKVKKLLKEDFSLKVTKDLSLFEQKIHHYHNENCWLTQNYMKCITSLSSRTLEADNFEWVTVLLYREEEVVAGELGYFIGQTYTSLTGFCNRSISGSGTLQMVLLAQMLERYNIHFWNMGHPYMDYKVKLGAKIYPRKEFLKLWFDSNKFTGKSLKNLLDF